MKLLKLLFLTLLVLFVAGVGYVSFIDVPVPQSEIVKSIPHEELFSEEG